MSQLTVPPLATTSSVTKAAVLVALEIDDWVWNVMGNMYTSALAASWIGYGDDLRITKNVARYTGAHAVPTAAFLNS